MQSADQTASTGRRRQCRRKLESEAACAPSSQTPASTLRHRRSGRPSIKDKAVSQQYLTPQEEKALEAHILRCHRNGHPLQVKDLPLLAAVIVRQRSSVFQLPAADQDVHPPTKTWTQAFKKRHPDICSRRLKALDSRRDGPNIRDKVIHWFEIIGQELRNPSILPENVYNMDETGIILSAPHSMKMLVSRDVLCSTRGVGVQRTLVTAVECVSAWGQSLTPLIVWPAATHRSNWTTHPTPGWHFAVSRKGYADKDISLYWIRHVFEPQTRARANHKPRILISDGFASHESAELIQFCFANNIILCRLLSHTSHKLQPLDVAVFGPLKTAYREQVERLHRGGANTVGKEHFTLLYSRARDVALTVRNIKSGWAKAGLFPFNPDRVLREIPEPPSEADPKPCHTMTDAISADPTSPVEALITPVTADNLASLCKNLEQRTHLLDQVGKQELQKIINGAKKAFTERDLLFIGNDELHKQNNEKNVRQTAKAQIVGGAKVMTWEDLRQKQQLRDAREAAKEAAKENRAHRNNKRIKPAPEMMVGKGRRTEEGAGEVRHLEPTTMEGYCSIIQF